MNSYFIREKTRFFSGWRAWPTKIKFKIELGKHVLLREKIPLLLVIASRGRLRKSFRKLELGKIVKFNNSYYTSLVMPHWPSEAFDHMVANGGLDFSPSTTRFKRHINSAFLAITQRCNYRCRHCYEYLNLANKDTVPVQRWKDVIKVIQKIGTSVIVLSGGEPMLRYDDLIELLESGDKCLSDFHIHTSGQGLNLEKALRLKKAGLHAAGVGLDDVDPDRHDAIRGYKGAYKEALTAIKYFQDAGVFTYINMCLTKELVRSGELPSYIELAKDLGVGIIRFLEPKPYGRYFNADMEDLFTTHDKKTATEFFIEANKGKKYRNYPLISYEAFFEDPERMGCMMGGYSHFYIDSLGNVEPCVFLPVSFGNIMEEDFMSIFKRMKKAVPAPLYIPCPAASLAEKIKSKHDQGLGLPMPYMAIKEEWHQMIGGM